MAVEYGAATASVTTVSGITQRHPVCHGVVDLLGEVTPHQPFIHGIETALAVAAIGLRFWFRRLDPWRQGSAIIAVVEVRDELPQTTGATLLFRGHGHGITVNNADRARLLGTGILVNDREFSFGEERFFVLISLRLGIQRDQNIGNRH